MLKKEEKVIEVKKVEREEVKLSKWITIIDGKMWQDEPYTKEEEKAYNEDFEHGKVLHWNNGHPSKSKTKKRKYREQKRTKESLRGKIIK